MNRRSFMQSILAAGAAPYVVTSAGVLMPVRPLWTPKQQIAADLFGNLATTMVKLLQNGERWMSHDGGSSWVESPGLTDDQVGTLAAALELSAGAPVQVYGRWGLQVDTL